MHTPTEQPMTMTIIHSRNSQLAVYTDFNSQLAVSDRQTDRQTREGILRTYIVGTIGTIGTSRYKVSKKRT